MTINELYEWAKNQNLENAQIEIAYFCDDDYYDYKGKLQKDELIIKSKKRIIIQIVT